MYREKVTEEQDIFKYAQDIKEAFPKALIKFIDNFDDYYFGWEICPEPRILIKFQVAMDSQLNLRITAYEIQTWNNDNPLKVRQLFYGQLPANEEDHEPDTYFLRAILRNWKTIG